MAPPSSSERRGSLLVLAYLWIFCVIPLAVEKSDPVVRWHARHGLVLLIWEVVALLAATLVGALVAMNAPRALALLSVLDPWVTLLVLWLHVVAAWQALHGRRLLVPGISHHADPRGGKRV